MIVMAGIDYKLAPVNVREKLSFTEETADRAYLRIKQMADIQGAVLVSTCNRTELYLSAENEGDPFGLLCELAGVRADDYPHYAMTGLDVMRHLCRLASGIQSQIWGEDQILTQVKNAIIKAREHNAASNVLEVMFREAVTAAKRLKSELRLGVRETSIVDTALGVIRGREGILRVLVIGNGEIGRLMTRRLVENGFHTTMTLRTYRHGETVVPAGAHTVPYEGRYNMLESCDVLISATRSPHYTIEPEKIHDFKRLPKLWLDLAVPHDINPEIAKIPDIEYYDVDGLGASGAWEGHEEKLQRAEEIIGEHTANFKKWHEYRLSLYQNPEKNAYFPLFIPTSGKKALLAGGGKIAARRAAALIRFGFDVTVVAPDATAEIKHMRENSKLTLILREFRDTDLDGCFLVVAATDERETNRRIGVLATERGIFASIADCREECTFLFPALAAGGDIVAGLTSGGKSHHAVAEAAKRVREVL